MRGRPPTNSRHWNRDEDMGGSEWSGASGRGGMGYDERAYRGLGATNEPYGGGGWIRRDERAGGLDFGEREIDRGPFHRSGPKGYRRPDARIYEDVCEIIAEQGHIDARDVEVSVEAGVVRLAGTVVRRHDRRILEHMIDGVRGIEEIQNDLRVRRELRDDDDGDGRDQRNGSGTRRVG